MINVMMIGGSQDGNIMRVSEDLESMEVPIDSPDLTPFYVKTDESDYCVINFEPEKYIICRVRYCFKTLVIARYSELTEQQAAKIFTEKMKKGSQNSWNPPVGTIR